MNDALNPALILQAVILAAGGKINITEDDVNEAQMGMMDGAMLQVIRLPAFKGFELIVRDPNAPIQETVTIVDQRALPAPRKG